MPFKSQAQLKKFIKLEATGQLPKGTTKKWKDETPNLDRLPKKAPKKGRK